MIPYTPLYLLVALPFIGSFIALLLPANARNAEAAVAGIIALACTTLSMVLFPHVMQGNVLRETIPWIPSLGLNLVFRLDGFAWLFCTLIYGIGALVVLYARYYLSPSDPVPRFFSFLLAFMGSMGGVVLSGNILQIVLFWELTSLFSFLLIGYWHHRKDARRGARMALTVTGAGGFCLLAGMLIIGHMVQSYDLDTVLRSTAIIRSHPLYRTALILVLLGAFTKSAQFPFQFWLPNAMAAPTPVSAYLHSATMVKAGVFLLARLWPVLAGTGDWFWIVTLTGATTLLVGSYLAMFQTDLKGLLAYSTISHLGLITLLLGLNSTMAAVAAVFHILNHATFKASLFMAAGIIDHETGTRDIRRLNGLLKVLPMTSLLALIASCAMAGVPMLNGFLSKEMFFAEAVHLSHGWIGNVLPVIATMYSAFAVFYALRFCSIFSGPLATDLPKPAIHEPPLWMRLPVILLVAACLFVGMFPQLAVGDALAAAALPVVGGALPEYSLAVWHGITWPLIMSMIALATGIALYIILRRPMRRGRIASPPLLGRLNGQRSFEILLFALSQLARHGLRALGTRRLQPQLFILVFVAVAAAALVFWQPDTGMRLTLGTRELLPASSTFAMLWLCGCASAIGAALLAKFHRLAAFLLVSVAGLITCITFVWFSAPDLALTQLAVEVVTAVLILLGLRWLPKRVSLKVEKGALNTVTARARRLRDILIATFAGSGVALLAFAVMTREFTQSISPYFLKFALPEGGGTNVVNVMLVDFRGFDTMGEITVLAAVALAVYALLRRFRPAPESAVIPPQQQAVAPDVATDLVDPRQTADTALGYLMVPAVLARLFLPLALVFAVYLFMRGHNQPGGGFVAGLAFATAFIVQFMVAGTQWVEAHIRLMPQRWMAVGLLIAAGTGLGALAAGFPFLTSHAFHFSLPVLGEMHIPSALFFDIGIFSLVVGAVLLILTALAHQSVRANRAVEIIEANAEDKPRHEEARASPTWPSAARLRRL